ncbi:protein DDI1 homolog 2 isoform X1 [Cottoperca gobio]|uniref:Protein DDI1 homolog 2 isoform X1 n=1 Tax=Cottoperca gobio TaxID=56716 RepID=A0A6J2PR69_COTGO|nr:protein DDI1 homolog 2 isoform X1 [Cottoperca gobio]
MSSSPSPSQSPSSGQPQTPDCSPSAPTALEQASAPGLCRDHPGLQELPRPLCSAEDAGSTPHQVHPHPLPVDSNSRVSPVPCPSTDALRTCPPPADMTTASQYPEDEVQPGHAEGDAESDEVKNSPVLPNVGELSPIQPMEQEATESDIVDATDPRTSAPSQPDSVEMESPTASQGVASPERDQPEGEHCSSSDNIPSLAAALMELHELLVSNNRAQFQNRSTSCSPSHPFKQETDDPKPCTPTPEKTQRIPSTAIPAGAEPSDAKANHAAPVSNEGPSNCLVPDVSGQDEHLRGDTAQTVEGQGPPQRPVYLPSSRERRADKCGRDEVNNVSSLHPEPEVPPDPARDLDVREPPEGQQGRGVADGRASGTNTPDTLGLQTEHTFLSPLSMAVGSPEEVSSTSSLSSPRLAQAAQLTSPAPLLPSPHPFIEQFPAAHIQRIQAAGFSAREAAEALEQAHGVVELALLALLARSITVPT